MVAVTSSVLSLTIISGDRFIAIVFPLRARMTTTRAGIIITVTWLISIGVAIPQLIVRRQTEFRWANRHEIYCDEVWPTTYVNNRCEVDQPERKVYYTMFVFVLYFVPILVMILAYSVIVWTLLKRKAPGVAIMSTALAQEKSKRKVCIACRTESRQCFHIYFLFLLLPLPLVTFNTLKNKLVSFHHPKIFPVMIYGCSFSVASLFERLLCLKQNSYMNIYTPKAYSSALGVTWLCLPLYTIHCQKWYKRWSAYSIASGSN